MSEYKICVYAIAKNEEKFVRRWAESMSEADEITVLDTGSTDGTVKALLQYPKIKVYKEEIVPWRFDTARNRSLELVAEDADLCVCTDPDEVFRPGWRKGVEEALAVGATQIRYRYTWNFLPDGKEGTVFFADKMHARRDFTWTHPVHEVIRYVGGGENKVVTAANVQLDHRADPSKSRAQYLSLLELSVAEAPLDDRNTHYLAREYMFHRRYADAVRMFLRHLELPTATWRDERCASMRYLAKCYSALGKEQEAVRWLWLAAGEAPYLREPWMDMAAYYYEKKNWYAVIFAVKEALKIKDRPDTYMTLPEAWSERPYDLLSLAFHYTGDRENALLCADTAIRMAPENERLKNNRKFFEAGL